MYYLICTVLHVLRSTGLDPEGRYCRLLWLHDGKVEMGLKIPAGGDTKWVSMLKRHRELCHVCLHDKLVSRFR